MYGDREAALAHELTKMFESVERGTISALIGEGPGVTLKGEYVIVVSGLPSKVQEEDSE